ncbi:APC family permease [Ktedonosporobacter rubrisoli]|nr:APC family permease [Ktedonosporobacter rubrisoli]
MERPAPYLESTTYLAKALPALLGTFDMFASCVVVILWLVNSASASLGGPVGLTYWLLGGLTFLLPSMLITAQLGVMFPLDGSLYTWTYQAFSLGNRRPFLNTFWSFLIGGSFWLIGPMALVIAANAFLSFIQGIAPPSLQVRWLSQPWQQGLFMIGIVLICNVVALQRFRIVQNLVNAIFVLNLLAFVLIALSGGLWLLSGHPSATDFSHLAGWMPNQQNVAAFGLICLGYLGAPTSVTMIGEFRQPQQVRRAIVHHLRLATMLVIPVYLVITAVLLLFPSQALANPSNVNFLPVEVVDLVLGKGFGNLTAICLLAFFLISPVVYHLASSRILMMGGIDHRIPEQAGKLSKERVPVVALWVQTGVAVLMLAVIYLIGPIFTSLGQPADLASKVYNVVLASLTLVSVVATLFLYINLLVAYRRAPSYVQAHRLVPLWVLWLACVVGTGSCLLVFVDTLLNSWTPLMTNTEWLIAVGALILVLVLTLALTGIFAVSEASWQLWRHE